MISPWILGPHTSPSLQPYDFHMHTTWTDGKQSAKEMHEVAIAQGLKAILFSEHARKNSTDWFPTFAAEVRALPQDQCRTLVGVEAKVDDFTGALDSHPSIIELCDLVMASVHRFPGEEGDIKGTQPIPAHEAMEIELRLAMAVLDNPDVDILGHVFGMSLKRFKANVPEEMFLQVIKKAATTGVAIEINSHYHPDPMKLLQLCLKHGANYSLGSNAHNIHEVGHIQQTLTRQGAQS